MQQHKAKNLYLRGDVWYFLGYINKKRVRLSTGCKLIEDAIEWKEKKFPAKAKKPIRVSMLQGKRPFVITDKFVTMLHGRIKARSKAMGEDGLTKDDLISLLKSSGGRCQLTGIQFVRYNCDGESSRHPFAPSIDRINSKKPYTKENCRVVCVAVNYAMNEWGQEVFDVIAAARLETKLRLLGVA